MYYYDCDICEKEGETHGKNYYGTNAMYGYCDSPKCREEARRRLSADMYEQIDAGRVDMAMELAGDEDPILYL